MRSFNFSTTMCKFVLILFFGIGAALSNPLQSRILNGNNARPAQFPWMVSLRSVQTSSHVCGGALVTAEHVVTAGHCIFGEPEDFFVVSGHINNWQGGRNTAVHELRIHPQFLIAYAVGYDIGVVKLATPVRFNPFELPIPIATKDPGVYPCVLSGWGITKFPSSSSPATLQTVILESMTRETCLQSWSPLLITDAVLCAGGVLTEGGCFGDSGSPLVCDGELAGAVSTGDSCANGRPDLYSKVFYHRDWILETISDLSPLGRLYEAEAEKLLPKKL